MTLSRRTESQPPRPTAPIRIKVGTWSFYDLLLGVASKGIREWWDAESGKLAFMPKVRALIDRKLGDTADPPVPFNKMWSIFTTEAWESNASDLET